MQHFLSMLLVESRKATRSTMPLWTGLGALFMPLSFAFLIFVARHPELSQQLGLVSAKANLAAYAQTGWTAYFAFINQLVAAGALMLGILVISWIFGREFADGTVKDFLAVPVKRTTIIGAKFTLATIWTMTLLLLIFATSIILGQLMQLPGWTTALFLGSCKHILIIGILTLLSTYPFALLASVGRGYLLPLGIMLIVLMSTNIVSLLGWAAYFPWAIPGLYGQHKEALSLASVVIVTFTGAAGILTTIKWWKNADQQG